MYKASIAFLILMLLLFGNSIGYDKVLDKRTVSIKAKVKPYAELKIEPGTIILHEIGEHILFSKEYIVVSVYSNSPFVISFLTTNTYGYVSKDEYNLETYYIVVPFDAPEPSLDDHRWINGNALEGYVERPDDYNNYIRKIFVKAIKNSPPYGRKDFRNTVTINIKNNDEINLSGSFQVLYK